MSADLIRRLQELANQNIYEAAVKAKQAETARDEVKVLEGRALGYREVASVLQQELDNASRTVADVKATAVVDNAADESETETEATGVPG